jgi:DNA-binding MarR family transcriptional regulator
MKKQPPLTNIDLTQFSKVYDRPGYLIRRLHQESQAIFDAEVGSYGLTGTQYSILSVVKLVPGMEQREIAEASHYDRATTGGVLKRLERLGLIRTEKGLRSRRGHSIYITVLGERKLKTMERPIARVQTLQMKGLDAAECAQFLCLLSKLTDTSNRFHP